MQPEFERIAERLRLAANGVHLVHYVLRGMLASYVAPPRSEKVEYRLFTAPNICSAILAYLQFREPSDPIGLLKRYGIERSEEIGRIVKELHRAKPTTVAKKLSLKRKDFDGLFSVDSVPEVLRYGRWFEGAVDDLVPDRKKTAELLLRHFAGMSMASLVIGRRMFPRHVEADLQVALDAALGDCSTVELFGLNISNAYEGISFARLVVDEQHRSISVGPLNYHDIDIGAGVRVSSLQSGLWLGVHGAERMPFAIVKGSAPVYSEARAGLLVEIAVPATSVGTAHREAFVQNLEHRMVTSACYRGKILSFEQTSDHRGQSSGIRVHELRSVKRDEVILPSHTLELLDRNIIEFVERRPSLAERGMNLKKGLLFYGPPGTGKTHTVHYLTRAMQGHTTLLISADQVGLLAEYMNLARLLQPSLVIIEDADLIARDREEMDTCEEVLLNRLLNEMDGLRADSEVIVILTTNRPESLEAALTARPGRVDQAIEFPLPDEEGRDKLARLYAGRQAVSEDVVARVVRKTERTSAAFIKELMRRATQYAVSRGADSPVDIGDVDTVIEEMLVGGGALNRKILGAADREE